MVEEVYSPRFLVEVWTHRPKARVSAVEKAEEARCCGKTFESWLAQLENSRNFCVEVGTHRPKACVICCTERLRKRGVMVGPFESWVGEVATLANFFEVKWGRTAQRRVSPLKRRLRKARCYCGTFESWLHSWKTFLANFLCRSGDAPPEGVCLYCRKG